MEYAHAKPFSILLRLSLAKALKFVTLFSNHPVYSDRPRNWRDAGGHLPRKLRDTEIAPNDLRHVRKAGTSSLTIGNRELP